MANKHYGTKTGQTVIYGACIYEEQTVRRIRKDRKGNVMGLWQPKMECENHAENAARVIEVIPQGGPHPSNHWVAKRVK